MQYISEKIKNDNLTDKNDLNKFMCFKSKLKQLNFYLENKLLHA